MDNISDIATPLAKHLAEIAVDEQIAHHPEYFRDRERILKVKEKETKEQLDNTLKEILDDLQKAGDYLKGWINNLPPENRDKLLKEFKRAGEIYSSDWFIQNMKESMENPIEHPTPLQKLLKLTDDTLQAVYTAGTNLQKEGDFTIARAIFRFLAFLNPLVDDFWIGLGFALLNLQRYNEAHTSFEFAQVLDPENPKALYFSAICCTVESQYDTALIFCDSGLELAKEDTPHLKWKTNLNELKESLKSKMTPSGGNL